MATHSSSSFLPAERPQLLFTFSGQQSHHIRPRLDLVHLSTVNGQGDMDYQEERPVPGPMNGATAAAAATTAAAPRSRHPTFEQLSLIGGPGRRTMRYESYGPIRRQLYRAGVTPRRCQERFCRGPPLGDQLTFPCSSSDHSPPHPPFDVCLECIEATAVASRSVEDLMVQSNRLYLCGDCTLRRARLPPLQQPWEHPLRAPFRYTRDRRSDGTCGCHDRLRNLWLCSGHLYSLFSANMHRGTERVAVFERVLGRRDVCPSCWRAGVVSEGVVRMWCCAVCEDLVMEGGQEEEEELEGEEKFKKENKEESGGF